MAISLKTVPSYRSNEGKCQNQDKGLEMEGNHSPELWWLITEISRTVNIQESDFPSSGRI